MKLTELFRKDAQRLSFEVFPPKTDSTFDSVKTATEEIARLRPSFMSVTYGAGGGTSRYTLEIAKNIKDLKFKNTTNHNIIIDAVAKDGVLTVNLLRG